MKNLNYITSALVLFFSLNMSFAQGPNANSNDVAQSSEQIQNSLARYYYYPNLQAYYDSETATYLFIVNGEWMEATTIPANYKGYAIKNGLKVALASYTGDTPFDMIEQHKTMFPADYTSKRKAPKMEQESRVAYK